MKVEVKKVDATKREIKFELPKDRVSKTMDEVYKEIGKVAKIKGFRPGKAPRHLLEQHHSELAREETLKKAIPKAYQEAIEKEALNPIDLPEIHDVSLKDGILSFKAVLDIKPDVKVKSYKEISVKKKNAKVTDEEINKTLEFFKQGQGKADEKDKDKKEIKIDDEFAKGLGYPSLDDFKTALKRQMEIDKEQHNRFDVENQIVEHLIKNSSIAVPQSVLSRQLEHRMEDLKKRFTSQGAKEEDIKKRMDEMRPNMKKAAEKDLKVFFILERIAQLENIKVEQNENMVSKVLAFLLKEAKWEEAK